MPSTYSATIRALTSKEPLSREDEVALADEAGSDSDAAWELVLHNMRFIVTLCERYADEGHSVDDLLYVAYMEAFRAAHRHDPSTGFRFITYFSRCVSWRLHTEVNKSQDTHADIDRFDDKNRAVSDTDSFCSSSGVSGSKQMAGLALECLTPLERRVVTLRHGVGQDDEHELSFRAIGEIVGLTGQGALIAARRAYKKAAKSPALKEYRRLTK